MNFLNSIFYKSMIALYKLNTDKDGLSKNTLIKSIFEGLLIGKDGLDKSKLEMTLKSATGEWLDFWGNFYGIQRLYNEHDDKYRERIRQEVLCLKSTVRAMESAADRYVRMYTNQYIDGFNARVFEPWESLIKLDQRGTIDGYGRIISYEYWTYGVIDITIPDAGLITKPLIEYLNRIKASGVKLYFSISPVWGIIKDEDYEERRYRIWFRIVRDFVIYVKDRETIVNELVIERLRHYYVTQTIRNHLSSAVISLSTFKQITDNKNMTIGDGIELENESFNGTRDKEGRLTITQGKIEIIREPLYEFMYVSYSGVDLGSLNKLDCTKLITFGDVVDYRMRHGKDITVDMFMSRNKETKRLIEPYLIKNLKMTNKPMSLKDNIKIVKE